LAATTSLDLAIFLTAAESRGTNRPRGALSRRSAGKSSVIRPWQPAFPQAMQRHGGRTRPAVAPVAKAATSPRENADESNRSDANAASAPDKSSASKD